MRGPLIAHPLIVTLTCLIRSISGATLATLSSSILVTQVPIQPESMPRYKACGREVRQRTGFLGLSARRLAARLLQPDVTQARLSPSPPSPWCGCIGGTAPRDRLGPPLDPLWGGMKDLNRDLSVFASSVAGHDVATDVAVDGPALSWLALDDGDTRRPSGGECRSAPHPQGHGGPADQKPRPASSSRRRPKWLMEPRRSRSSPPR